MVVFPLGVLPLNPLSSRGPGIPAQYPRPQDPLFVKGSLRCSLAYSLLQQFSSDVIDIAFAMSRCVSLPRSARRLVRLVDEFLPLCCPCVTGCYVHLYVLFDCL